MRRALRQLRGASVFSALTLNTIFWCIPLFAVALVKLLIPYRAARRGLTGVLMKVGENWVAVNARILGLNRRALLAADSVDRLEPNGWYLLISNHLSWVDIVALQTVFNRRVPFLKFFIKQELVWFPFLGLAWLALDMPFMKRYSKSYLAQHPEKRGLDFEATRAACRKFSEIPTSVINFVEGTRFTDQKRLRRHSPFENLLPPRAGGVALALSSMGSMFDAILDVTVVYPDGVTEFWGMCCGDLGRVVVDVRQQPIEPWMVQGDYVNDREYRGTFHRWLTSLWQRKDQRIRELRSNEMPGRNLTAG